jgi:UPF0755 protein
MPAADAIARAAAPTDDGAATRGRETKGRSKNSGPVNAFAAMGAGIDELGLEVRGATATSPGAALDGGVDDPIDSAAIREPEPDLTTFAVPADRRAEQKVKSARNGLPVGADELPHADDLSAGETSHHEQPSDPSGASATKAPRIYDVSEGTKLDPLRNRTYDLNYAKTVPSHSKK